MRISSTCESTSDCINHFSSASTGRLDPSWSLTPSRLFFWSSVIVTMTPRIILPLFIPSGILFSLRRSVVTFVISLDKLMRPSSGSEYDPGQLPLHLVFLFLEDSYFLLILLVEGLYLLPVAFLPSLFVKFGA